MKKQKIYFGVTILMIIAVLGLLGWKIFWSKTPVSNLPNGPETSRSQVKGVDLAINNGEEIKNFKVDFKEGMTAFDVLKAKTDELSLNLKTKEYDMGIFIEAIGDKENGQDGKYWMYYVNGQLPMIAADKNAIKAGDKVEFKFEKSPF